MGFDGPGRLWRWKAARLHGAYFYAAEARYVEVIMVAVTGRRHRAHADLFRGLWEAVRSPHGAVLWQARQEHQKCIRSRKLDPLNMQAWYPACGEAFEIEGACAVALLGEIDKRCCSQLDAAASRLKAAGGDHGDASLKAALNKVGECLAKVAQDKSGLSLDYDIPGARRRFEMSRQIMERNKI